MITEKEEGMNQRLDSIPMASIYVLSNDVFYYPQLATAPVMSGPSLEHSTLTQLLSYFSILSTCPDPYQLVFGNLSEDVQRSTVLALFQIPRVAVSHVMGELGQTVIHRLHERVDYLEEQGVEIEPGCGFSTSSVLESIRETVILEGFGDLTRTIYYSTFGDMIDTVPCFKELFSVWMRRLPSWELLPAADLFADHAQDNFLPYMSTLSTQLQ